MILELIHILRDQPESAYDGHLLTNYENDTYTTTTTGGSSTPRSGTASVSTSSGSSNTAPGNSGLKASDRNAGGEPQAKKSGGSQTPSARDSRPSAPISSQMPCPLRKSNGCLGTNATISEMLRSLQNQHCIVICKDCCTQVEVSHEENSPESVLRRHASGGCEPRCISADCSATELVRSPVHRRTENCPSWKAIPKEIERSFLWTLINPGQEVQAPEFLTEVGFEHSNKLKPCKEKSRTKGIGLCRNIDISFDARQERIRFLEHELEASAQRAAQIQQLSSEKIANLEQRLNEKHADLGNIIETLLERLKDHRIDIPRSLHKRISQECPDCMLDTIIHSTPMPSRTLPTPDTTPTDPNFSATCKSLGTAMPPVDPPPFFAVSTKPQSPSDLPHNSQGIDISFVDGAHTLACDGPSVCASFEGMVVDGICDFPSGPC